MLSINAVSESFFAIFKTEALDGGVPDDHDAGHRLICDYIDRYYNAKRGHPHIDYESPIQFELRFQLAAMAA